MKSQYVAGIIKSFYTTKELATKLGVTTRMIRYYRKWGVIPESPFIDEIKDCLGVSTHGFVKKEFYVEDHVNLLRLYFYRWRRHGKIKVIRNIPKEDLRKLHKEWDIIINKIFLGKETISNKEVENEALAIINEAASKRQNLRGVDKG